MEKLYLTRNLFCVFLILKLILRTAGNVSISTESSWNDEFISETSPNYIPSSMIQTDDVTNTESWNGGSVAPTEEMSQTISPTSVYQSEHFVTFITSNMDYEINDLVTKQTMSPSAVDSGSLFIQPSTTIAILDQPSTTIAILDQPRTTIAILDQPRTTIAILDQPRTSIAILDQPRTTIAILDQPRTTIAILDQLSTLSTHIFDGVTQTQSNYDTEMKYLSSEINSFEPSVNIPTDTFLVLSVTSLIDGYPAGSPLDVSPTVSSLDVSPTVSPLDVSPTVSSLDVSPTVSPLDVSPTVTSVPLTSSVTLIIDISPEVSFMTSQMMSTMKIVPDVTSLESFMTESSYYNTDSSFPSQEMSVSSSVYDYPDLSSIEISSSNLISNFILSSQSHTLLLTTDVITESSSIVVSEIYSLYDTDSLQTTYFSSDIDNFVTSALIHESSDNPSTTTISMETTSLVIQPTSTLAVPIASSSRPINDTSSIPERQAGGLSSGGKIALGICIPVIIIALLAGIIYLVYRRRYHAASWKLSDVVSYRPWSYSNASYYDDENALIIPSLK